MQIAYHIGVTNTDSDALFRSLARSADQLTHNDIALPGPSRYRRVLREAVQNFLEGPVAPDIRDRLIEEITPMTEARRLILSNPYFFCQPNRVFERGSFFRMAGFKCRAFRRLFPDDDLSIFMGIRNPASFIPAAWRQARVPSLAGFLGDTDLHSLSWVDVVQRMRSAAPDIPITLWCNEDTPLIWGELIHRLADLPEGQTLPGSTDLAESLMQPEGIARMRAYLENHPPSSPLQERRVIGAFLDKYFIADMVEEEITAPGWDDDLIEDLTANYEEEIEDLGRIDGVTLIRP